MCVCLLKKEKGKLNLSPFFGISFSLLSFDLQKDTFFLLFRRWENMGGPLSKSIHLSADRKKLSFSLHNLIGKSSKKGPTFGKKAPACIFFSWQQRPCYSREGPGLFHYCNTFHNCRAYALCILEHTFVPHTTIFHGNKKRPFKNRSKSGPSLAKRSLALFHHRSLAFQREKKEILVSFGAIFCMGVEELAQTETVALATTPFHGL